MNQVNPNSLTGVFLGSLQELVTGLIVWIPKLLIAILIWWLGNVFLNLLMTGARWLDIPGTKIDDKIIKKFNKVLMYLGKFLLILIILDYLGIGDTVIGAIANGLTLTIALILGISFGQSLKPYTDKWVNQISKQIKK